MKDENAIRFSWGKDTGPIEPTNTEDRTDLTDNETEEIDA
jgi:hypothetical protein